MITYKQLSLADIFSDCQNKFDNNKHLFLSLLDQTINLDEIVPVSFVTHFHASTGRPRKHQLYPMLKALLTQCVFSIPTDSLLILFLKYSQELRDFCSFDVFPDASKFSRFKQDFLLDLQSVFDLLVDLTEPICQKLDPDLASMTIFDTSGIEAWVTKNNPKYANHIIKQLKAFKKSHNLDNSYDPYNPDVSVPMCLSAILLRLVQLNMGLSNLLAARTFRPVSQKSSLPLSVTSTFFFILNVRKIRPTSHAHKGKRISIKFQKTSSAEFNGRQKQIRAPRKH